MDRDRRSEGKRGPGPATAVVQPGRRPLRLSHCAVILNEAKRSERSGLRSRNLFRTPDPSAAPQDDTRRRAGFTLIELLVVIAVIALLMGILMPVLGRVRKQARTLACRSKLRQWGIALHTYTVQNEGRAPSIWGENGRGVLPWERTASESSDVLLYRGNDEMLLCPTASKVREEGGSFGRTFAAWSWTYAYPDWTKVMTGSYGWNGHVGLPVGRDPAEHDSWRTVDVKGAACIPYFFDCTEPYFGVVDLYDFGLGPPPQCEDSDDRNTGSHRICINRHDGGINMCFLDSSVRKVGLKELWTLKWARRYNTASRWTKAGGVQPEDWPKWMRGFKDY